jgi:hypothetical protein
MAVTLESHQETAPEEDSKSSSMVPLGDIEKTQLPGSKEATDGNVQTFQRPVKGFKWFLVCFGLYLGAVLYGEYFTSISIHASLLKICCRSGHNYCGRCTRSDP